MSDTKKRKCILCPSHEYEYCGKCKPKEVVETWRFIFDSENCRDIYKVIEKYTAKKITALEAREQLEKYKLPSLEEYQASLRKIVKEIFELTDELYKEKQIKSEDVKQVMEESVNQEEMVVESKPRRKRYSRRNSN